MAQKSTSGASNDFLSALGDQFVTGVGKITSEILPRWVAQQLDDQRTDQLFAATYDDRFSQPRLQQTTSTVQNPTKAGLFTGDNVFSISAGGLLVGGAVILGLFLLVRR